MDHFYRRSLAHFTITFVEAVISLQNTKKRIRSRRYWAKDWLQKREYMSHMALLQEIRLSFPDDYCNYLRMDDNTFQELLQLVTPLIQREDTILRNSISAEQRLVATLRFLATGQTLSELKYSTLISPQALGHIIPETCVAIISVLKQQYFKFPASKEEWQAISQDFGDEWDFPNCGGAIDGKHVRIIPPANSCSYYYNYKGFFSIVLMAIVNANYEFVFVDIGKNGRVSDGGLFEHTEFYRKMHSNSLNLPSVKETKHGLNFVFIADEAFALHQNLLKPYSQRALNPERQVFNYRLSRARRVVENAFGILSNRFRIFHSAINMRVDKIDVVVLACCVLHNYLRRKTVKPQHKKVVSADDTKKSDEDTSIWTPLEPGPMRKPSDLAKKSREDYVEFFNGIGAVSSKDDSLS